jgi:protein-tyrosine phosphatase
LFQCEEWYERMKDLWHAYGSKRGLLELMVAKTIMLCGGYGGLRSIDFSRVSRVVFICKGNICRSAYAEAWAKRLNVSAVSCGFDAMPRAPANERVARFARLRQVCLTEHQSQRFSEQKFRDGDLLVGMEPQHIDKIESRRCGAQVTLLGLWSKPARPYLHDPYSASDEYMKICMAIIESGVEVLASRLRNAAIPG